MQRLNAAYPQLGAVFAVDELSTEVLQHALRAGHATPSRIERRGERSTQAVGRVGELLGGAPAIVACAAVGDGPAADAPGRSIVVFSTKGGVGKSTIATNVAVAMARESRRHVALVDADLQFGDVAVLLGIPPRPHGRGRGGRRSSYADPELLRSLADAPRERMLRAPGADRSRRCSTRDSPDEMVARRAVASRRSAATWSSTRRRSSTTHVLALLEAADDVLLVG